ncbi:EGF-like domain-containing protein 1 [Haliotis rubra]|uniref:EGF-like domain-containing protein 1 n=1 Tax=Haliotis rubra TaxID=36100 RepID=UPI001EE53F1D|nr:EGF-like domain-containing protein 1 [Haliotis rubra]
MVRIRGVTARGVLLWYWLLVMQDGGHGVSIEFNCLREGTSCKAGGTCTPEGDCVCPGNTGGFDCSHDTSSNAADQRSCGCNEAAQGFFCKTNGDCFCPPSHYGNKCQFKTFQVVCSLPGKIITNINVPGAMTARVFLKDKRGSCDFSTTVPADTPAGWVGTFLEVGIDATSNCPAEIVTRPNGVVGHCVTSMLQYNALYISGQDAAIRLCCEDTVVSKDVGQLQPVDRSTTLAPQRTSLVHASSAVTIVLAVLAWSVTALLR